MPAFLLILIKILAAYSVVKFLGFLAKLGIFFASFLWVRSIVDDYIARVINALSGVDSAALQLAGLARIDECFSIIFSALICGVALKVGGKFFQGSQSVS